MVLQCFQYQYHSYACSVQTLLSQTLVCIVQSYVVIVYPFMQPSGSYSEWSVSVGRHHWKNKVCLLVCMHYEMLSVLQFV